MKRLPTLLYAIIVVFDLLMVCLRSKSTTGNNVKVNVGALKVCRSVE